MQASGQGGGHAKPNAGSTREKGRMRQTHSRDANVTNLFIILLLAGTGKGSREIMWKNNG